MNEILNTALLNPFDEFNMGLLEDLVADGFSMPGPILPRNVITMFQCGLPYGIRCHANIWFGKPCEECNAAGVYHDYATDGSWWQNDLTCPYCDATGFTGGIGKKVCEAWPIVCVELTGISPHDDEGTSFGSWSYRLINTDPERLTGDVYRSLFALLEGGKLEHEGNDINDETYIAFETRTQAVQALRRAALQWGRKAAVLPPIKDWPDMEPSVD